MNAAPTLDLDEAPEPGCTAQAVKKLLALRHPAPVWAGFAELRCGTGWSSEQRIDYFALHTWPSQNFLSIAYEIKVTREDFKRELAQPQKRTFAESVASECFFATPAGMVRVDEVPDGWGLIEVTRAGLKVKKVALQRSPEPWPMYFVASIARRSAVEDPEPVSKTLWSYAGRTVDEAALLKIADELRETALSQDRENIRHAAVERFKESRDYQRMLAVEAFLEEKLRVWHPTPERLQKWAEERQGNGISPEVMRQLQAVRRAIGELTGEEA